MVIYLPGQNVDEEPLLDELTPREIVRELDKHVVGQAEAKRAVAIALRNRIRRQKLPPEMAEEADRAEVNAEERLLDLLMPPSAEPSESLERTREKLRERLREGKLDERMVEIEVKDRAPSFEITTNTGIEEMGINLKDMLPNLFGQKSRKRKMRVAEGMDYLVQEEEQKL